MQYVALFLTLKILTLYIIDISDLANQDTLGPHLGMCLEVPASFPI